MGAPMYRGNAHIRSCAPSKDYPRTVGRPTVQGYLVDKKTPPP